MLRAQWSRRPGSPQGHLGYGEYSGEGYGEEYGESYGKGYIVRVMVRVMARVMARIMVRARVIVDMRVEVKDFVRVIMARVMARPRVIVEMRVTVKDIVSVMASVCVTFPEEPGSRSRQTRVPFAEGVSCSTQLLCTHRTASALHVMSE